MWTTAPVPGMVPPPLLNADEIDKRISDLKSVENWLTMNLSMLRMSIQGLEMQKATVGAFKTMQETQNAAQQQFAEAASAATAAASNAGDVCGRGVVEHAAERGQGGAPQARGSSTASPPLRTTAGMTARACRRRTGARRRGSASTDLRGVRDATLGFLYPPTRSTASPARSLEYFRERDRRTQPRSARWGSASSAPARSISTSPRWR